ncbi:MAG: hypothetical protein GEU92_19495 [Alphaproteobacteria bacterium]|nr:hypothetical protein [Alphaproteobacteria bacterium]
MQTRLAVRASAIAAAALAVGAPAVLADSVADFYKGKQITLVIPAGPGGSYGLYGQLGKAALEKFLPGKPTVVMQFMPGSGGAKATNYIATAAAQDGSVLLYNAEGAASQTQLFKPAAIRYDMAKFKYIGQYAPAPAIISVWANAPATSIEGAKKAEVVLGATGKGSQQYQVPALLNALIGTKFKVITGYKGSRGLFHAIENKEVHGGLASTVSWSTIRPEWVPQAMVVPIFQTGGKAAKGFEKVPLVEDVSADPVVRQMLRVTTSAAVMGRSMAAPPGIPADRLAAIRAAFRQGMEDAEVSKLAAKLKLPIDYTSGENLEKQVREILATPKPVVEKLKTILSIKG